MGLLSGMMGHASQVDEAAIEKEFSAILVGDEAIEAAFKLVRDMLVFTTKRLILVDRQGLTGRKTSYLSVPYADVARFSIETAGSFDADAELSIWLRGQAQPLKQEFRRGGDSIHRVHRLLATHVLK